MIAALFVEADGIYAGLPGVDLWDEARDARTYAGPGPVIAHPPCQRWGRFWHGSTRKPHQFALGDDGGCFEAALRAVNTFGGVLEHPADSHAWAAYGIPKPPRCGGWVPVACEPDSVRRGWTCYVEQGFYGHMSRKPTWLYAHGFLPPSLHWGRGKQRLHPTALAKHGYKKARRIGMTAMVGGKDKTKIRNATPIEFRDLLISMVMPLALAKAG